MTRYTPAFRIVLTVGAIWVVAIVAYGLTDSRFYFHVYQIGMEELRAYCARMEPRLLDQTLCVSAQVTVGKDPFWLGNPIWEGFKFALLPPLLVLGVIWFWSDITRTLTGLAKAYAHWIRGNPKAS